MKGTEPGSDQDLHTDSSHISRVIMVQSMGTVVIHWCLGVDPA